MSRTIPLGRLARLFASRTGVHRLLAADTALLVCALALTAITAQGPATRALAHSAAILTEVDSYLDARFSAIQQQAAQPGSQEITLPDFPIPVAFTPREVGSADREQFRALLLQRAGVTLHERGAAAFQVQQGGGVSLLSTQGPVRAAIDFLRPAPHRALTAATAVLAVAAAFLALRLVALSPGVERLPRLGRALITGPCPVLVLAIALRIALVLAAHSADDYVTREFLSLAGGLAWALVRDAAIFTALGVVIVIASSLTGRPSDADRERSRSPLDTAFSAE